MPRAIPRHVAALAVLSVLHPSAGLAAAQNATPAPKAGATLPIRQGYYASGRDTCAAAMADFTLGMFVKARRFEYNDVVREIVRVSPRPAGEFLLMARMVGEGGQVTSTSTIRIISPTSFSETSSDPDNPKARPVTLVHRYCSAKPPADWNF